MSKTTQDLAEEVLLELGRADAANPAQSPEDIASVKRRYAGLIEEMRDAGFVFWDANTIPERVFPALAQHVAFAVRASFGAYDYNPLDAQGRTPLQRLQAMASRGANVWPVKAEYF